LLHDNFNLSCSEVFNETVKFAPFDTHEFYIFFLFSNTDFEIKLFANGIDSMELSCIDIFNSEVKNWLRNENDALLEHIQPSGLSLDVRFDARLSLF